MQDITPLARRQQGATHPLLCNPPPCRRLTEDQVGTGLRVHLDKEQDAAWGKQSLYASQRLAQIASKVQDVASNDEIELAGFHVLLDQVAIEVQDAIANETKGAKSLLRAFQHRFGAIAEKILRSLRGKDRQYARRKSASAAPKLQNPQRTIRRILPHDFGNGAARDLVVDARGRRAVVVVLDKAAPRFCKRQRLCIARAPPPLQHRNDAVAMNEKAKLRRIGGMIPNQRAPEHGGIGQGACRRKARSFCRLLQEPGLLRNLDEALQVGPLVRPNATELDEAIRGETLIAGSEDLERPSSKNCRKLIQTRSNIAVMRNAIVSGDECFDVRRDTLRDQRRRRKRRGWCRRGRLVPFR